MAMLQMELTMECRKQLREASKRIERLCPAQDVSSTIEGNHGEIVFRDPKKWREEIEDLQDRLASLHAPIGFEMRLLQKQLEHCALRLEMYDDCCGPGLRVSPPGYRDELCSELAELKKRFAEREEEARADRE
jgi:hypothetical protein